MNDIYDLIAKKYNGMTKSQKKIASYILENRSQVAFMNVSDLAKAVQISEASVIRFATFLGYKGYPDFRKELQENVKKISIADRLAISYNAYDSEAKGFVDIMQEDISRIQNTLNQIDEETFHKIVMEILSAKKICIVCGRSASALGFFFQYYLKMVVDNVTLVDTFEGNEDVLCDVDEETVVIGITFTRYTKNTIRVMEYCYGRGARTIAITDFMTSPIIAYSHLYILADTTMPTYLDSFIAPLSVINAILTYVGKEKNRKLEKKLKELDEIWKSLDVFD